MKKPLQFVHVLRCVVVLSLLVGCDTDPAAPTVPQHRPSRPLLSFVPAPDSLFEEANWASAPDYVTSPFLRGIVNVQFEVSATAPEREAALDSVGGVIVGQVPLGAGEPWMVVELPNGPDSTVFVAIDILKRQAAVRRAEPELILEAPQTWQKLNDGTQWQKQDWRLVASQAYGGTWTPRWGLEAVSAPLAWGCSQGDGARVAVFVSLTRFSGHVVYRS